MSTNLRPSSVPGTGNREVNETGENYFKYFFHLPKPPPTQIMTKVLSTVCQYVRKGGPILLEHFKPVPSYSFPSGKMHSPGSWLSNFSRCHHHLEGLLKPRLLGPLPHLQVMLMLLVGPGTTL